MSLETFPRGIANWSAMARWEIFWVWRLTTLSRRLSSVWLSEFCFGSLGLVTADGGRVAAAGGLAGAMWYGWASVGDLAGSRSDPTGAGVVGHCGSVAASGSTRDGLALAAWSGGSVALVA
jgi:hypothetical protein